MKTKTIKRKPLSEETKKKISESLKGHPCYKSKERGKRISLALKGKPRKNPRKTTFFNKVCLFCKKDFIVSATDKKRKYCSRICFFKDKKGKPLGFKKEFEEIGITMKHKRMEKIKPKPDVCEICGKNKKLELSNNDHKYRINPNDWKWLCRKCHMLYDGRFEKLCVNPKFKKTDQNNLIKSKKKWKEYDRLEKK
ncbi:MAG: NUMOD3 domain-containing DNA-binding protein [Atribacterota bacterium]